MSQMFFPGQLHPGKMIQYLIKCVKEKGIEIVRGQWVEHLEESENEINCHVNGSLVWKARQVLIATNGFSNKLINDIDLKPARNQVLLTKSIPNLKLKGCFHYDQGYVYFRNVGERLLLGGGRHWDNQTAATDSYGRNELILSKLKHFMKEHLLPENNVEIDYSWSGILGVGTEKKPIVKYISPNLAIAIRMGGMGVAIGASVGEQAASLLLGK